MRWMAAKLPSFCMPAKALVQARLTNASEIERVLGPQAAVQTATVQPEPDSAVS